MVGAWPPNDMVATGWRGFAYGSGGRGLVALPGRAETASGASWWGRELDAVDALTVNFEKYCSLLSAADVPQAAQLAGAAAHCGQGRGGECSCWQVG